MGWRRLSASVRVLCGALLASAMLLRFPEPTAALTEVLSDREVAIALNLANSGDAQRARFHAPYIVAVQDPLIARLEVITEFRRFVTAAEEQLALGNWMLGRGGFDQKGRSLKDILRPFSGQVSIRAQLRFHPQNTYVSLPPFDILLGEPTLLAIDSTSMPHITPASGDSSRDVLDGATIEAAFNASSINDRPLPVRILSEGKELVRAVVDFSGFE